MAEARPSVRIRSFIGCSRMREGGPAGPATGASLPPGGGFFYSRCSDVQQQELALPRADDTEKGLVFLALHRDVGPAEALAQQGLQLAALLQPIQRFAQRARQVVADRK